MSNDKIIIEEIRAALDRDPRIPHPAEVAVSEQGGTVTLRGSVRSLHQRRAAAQIAKSVRGVRSVEDELRVDPRDRSADNEIRGAALQALSQDRQRMSRLGQARPRRNLDGDGPGRWSVRVLVVPPAVVVRRA